MAEQQYTQNGINIEVPTEKMIEDAAAKWIQIENGQAADDLGLDSDEFRLDKLKEIIGDSLAYHIMKRMISAFYTTEMHLEAQGVQLVCGVLSDMGFGSEPRDRVTPYRLLTWKEVFAEFDLIVDDCSEERLIELHNMRAAFIEVLQKIDIAIKEHAELAAKWLHRSERQIG